MSKVDSPLIEPEMVDRDRSSCTSKTSRKVLLKDVTPLDLTLLVMVVQTIVAPLCYY